MCGSYRPQYHEMVVHYAARFLDKIERVMWVGGGDSMLLHEILKYPSLELVVGLELDQLVTRSSYKHFGTQPHFDNEKVQWWYGDAAKSLLMLPKDYFGSFDMVLVDLSETVMSNLVTDGLDIFQALALLLKPRGIMMKNELYLEQMSDIFDYTIQIHYPNVPVVCSQCLVFGSNNVDFLWDEITDHETEDLLYIEPLAEINDRYEYFHDYRRNRPSRHLCTGQRMPEADPIEQKRSPGILLILEAEGVPSIQLTDAGKLVNVLSEAIQMVGFEVMLSDSSYAEPGAVATLILREGYVMARSWPHHKYCAIDIHLWSSFEKHEAVRKVLLDAIASKSSSLYRIVAGGMFGVSTWKEDTKKRGPRVVETCKQGEDHSREQLMKSDIANTIFGESIKLIPETNVKVVVICGVKKECSALSPLENIADIQVVPLMSCVSNVTAFEETAFHTMSACENETYTTLTKAISNGNPIRAMIIDPSASLLFTQVIRKVFKTRRSRLFDKRLFTAMAIMFDETESWRRNFMERLRKEIFHDPSFRAEVLFNGTDKKIELDVISSGDKIFVSRLKDRVSSIEEASGLVSDVRDIKGGPFVEDPNWKPFQFFLPEDYDQREALEQWESQQPLGFQTVFQLEAPVSLSNLGMSAESLLTSLREISLELEFGPGAKFHSVGGTGLGCVVAVLWSDGNCVALWDGMGHVDLNLFLLSEDTKLANNFSKLFKSKFSKIKFTTALKDSQPRGIGRVVNFKRDIEPRIKPHWARFKE